MAQLFYYLTSQARKARERGAQRDNGACMIPGWDWDWERRGRFTTDFAMDPGWRFGTLHPLATDSVPSVNICVQWAIICLLFATFAEKPCVLVG
jgi:hypothetical protein